MSQILSVTCETDENGKEKGGENEDREEREKRKYKKYKRKESKSEMKCRLLLKGVKNNKEEVAEEKEVKTHNARVRHDRRR